MVSVSWTPKGTMGKGQRNFGLPCGGASVSALFQRHQLLVINISYKMSIFFHISIISQKHMEREGLRNPSGYADLGAAVQIQMGAYFLTSTYHCEFRDL